MSSYLTIVPLGPTIIVLLLVAAGVTIAAYLQSRKRESFTQRLRVNSGWAIIIAGTLATAAYTLLPTGAPAPDRYIDWMPVDDLTTQFQDAATLTASRIQLAGNLLLLSWLALGVVLLSYRPRFLRVLYICLGASVLIEALQFLLNTGRVAALSDVILNTVGASLVGLLAIAILGHRSREGEARQAREPGASLDLA